MSCHLFRESCIVFTRRTSALWSYLGMCHLTLLWGCILTSFDLTFRSPLQVRCQQASSNSDRRWPRQTSAVSVVDYACLSNYYSALTRIINYSVMAEVQRLSVLKAPPPVVPAVAQMKRPPTKFASTVAQAPNVQPVSVVANGSGAQMKHSATGVVENNRPTSQDSKVQPVLYEYFYLHSDGVRRRGE